MLEKLIQAALITFLLHLIADISVNKQIPPKSGLPLSENSTGSLNSAIHGFE